MKYVEINVSNRQTHLMRDKSILLSAYYYQQSIDWLIFHHICFFGHVQLEDDAFRIMDMSYITLEIICYFSFIVHQLLHVVTVGCEQIVGLAYQRAKTLMSLLENSVLLHSSSDV